MGDPSRPGARRRTIFLRIAIVAALLVLAPLAGVWFFMVRTPGKSATRALPPLSADEVASEARLKVLVTELCKSGERNLPHPQALADNATMIERELTTAGLTPVRSLVEVRGVSSANIEATVRGTSKAGEIVLVGAHYDSAEGAPGANDNGSGVAALLDLASRLAKKSFARTVRFVAFTNEEPPYFRKPDAMGSRVYVKEALARGDRVVAMLSLETMGYFSDVDGTQQYPFPFSLFYPSRGDFIGFVSSLDSADLVRRAVGHFRARGTVPSEGGALPGKLPGVGWSDHESFYLAGVPALMVTDTAPFRYPHYHTAADTPDKLDYGRLARVVVGLAHVVGALADE